MNEKISQLVQLVNSQLGSGFLLPIVNTNTSQTDAVTLQNLLQASTAIFGLADSTDFTKLAQFNVSGFTTGTTNTFTLPNLSDTIATLIATQTFQNKTIGLNTNINVTGSDPTGSMYYLAASGALTPVSGTSAEIISFNASGIPTAIPNPAASNASLTVKGVGQEATQALTDAGTELGTTGAINIVTPLQLRARLLNTGVADTGSTNTYVIAPVPAITAYASYQEFTFIAANSNTGASTLNVSGLGTEAITKNGTIALGGGEIIAGQLYKVIYDGTRFQLVSPTGSGGFQEVTFSTTGTWICPRGVTSVYADIVSGGGGGGAGNSSGANSGGGGGGGGGGVFDTAVTVVPFTSYTVTVGAGGTAGTSGGTGGTGGASSFNGVTTSAGVGGAGGNSVTSGVGGLGGAAGDATAGAGGNGGNTATNGSIGLVGSAGGTPGAGGSASAGGGGGGTSGIALSGGNGGFSSTNATAAAFGGGGGGAHAGGGSASAGGAGIVVIKIPISQIA